MTVPRLAHWIGIAAALVPIPFVIYDAINLRLWQAEWYWLAVALLFTLALSLIAYGLVRGIGWLAAKFMRPTS